MRVLIVGMSLVFALVGGSAHTANIAPSGAFVLTWKKVESKGAVRVSVSIREKGRTAAVSGGVLDVQLVARGAKVTGCTLSDRARPNATVQGTCTMKGSELVIGLGEGGASDLRFELKPQGNGRYVGDAVMIHPLLPKAVVIGTAELTTAKPR